MGLPPDSVSWSCLIQAYVYQRRVVTPSSECFEILAVPAGLYDMEFVTLPTKHLKIFRASLSGVELRRGFATGPLVIDLEQQSLTDADKD